MTADSSIPQSSDIIIAVMGVTGAGKSTFISLFANEGHKPLIGDKVVSETQEVTFFPATLPNGTKLHLIDTPGFSDTYLSDSEVLEKISGSLAAAYERKLTFGGVIYLHPITEIRMTGPSLKNLKLFRELCGSDQFDSVVLVTTHWGSTEQQIKIQSSREEQLKANKDMWGRMVARGSTVFRQDQGAESAARIIQYLIDKKKPVVFDIQREVVDQGLKLKDTSAGKTVLTDLEKLQKKHEEELKEVMEEMKSTLAQRDRQMQQELEELKADLQGKLGRLEADREKLEKRGFQGMLGALGRGLDDLFQP